MVNVYSAYNQLDPVQAMFVNGKYLEQLVTGYRTLKVVGREPLNLDLEHIEIDTSDGGHYKRRRIDSRTIVIHFALTASSPATFAERFNLLKSYLYQIEESRIVFDDEPGKFFIGTYKGIKVDYPGRSASVGEIEIFCADPFKYSTTETTVQMQTVDGEKVLATTYQGTYPAHPVLIATCDEDNGFYGFAHSSGAMLQIGDPEEVDTQDVQRSEMLVNDSFEDGVPSGWTVNDGLTSTPVVDIQLGSWKECGSTNKGHGVTPDSFGTGNDWHGPGLNKVIPEDSNHDVGAKNFTMAWQWEMFAYRKDELLNMQVNIVGEKNNTKYLLAGVELMDGSPNGFGCAWRLWVNGVIVLQSSSATQTTTNHDNPWGGISCGESVIQKSGKKIAFKVAGQTYTFTNDDYEDLEALEITLYAAGHKTAMTSDHMAFFYVHFRKDAVDVTEDVPNKLMPGDVVVIDTGDGSITVNGTDAPELGAIGNQWEDFVLSPGVNSIVCAASSWVDDDTYTMKYREVYL